jgi:hypothetical protein
VLPCFALAVGWSATSVAAPPEDDGFSFEDDSDDSDVDDDDGEVMNVRATDAPEDDPEDDGETLSEDSGFTFEDISEDEEALAAELKSGEVQATGEVGTVSGRIVNGKGEPLGGVYVRALGTDYVGRTDINGVYQLKLPPGDYTLDVALDLYKSKQLTGVSVGKDATNTQNVELLPMAGVVETLVVEDNLNMQAEGALQERRKQQTTVNDGIDATEISKSGGGKVSSVAVRIVGATVVGRRYLFVRGLGHRYGNTLLDGARVPSPEPDLRTVPLDVFPSAALSAIDVQKTFSPDKPGDFTGGSVQFSTRDAPSQATLDIGVDVGVNTVTTFQPMITNGAFPGYDAVGFGHIPRGIPSSFPVGTKVGRGAFDELANPLYSAEEIQQQGTDLYTDYRIRRGATAPLNMGVKLTTGNSWTTNDNGGRVGVLFAGGYKSEHQSNRALVRLYGLDETTNTLGTSPPQVDFDSFQTVYSVNYNGLLKLEFDVNSNNRFDLTGLYSREATDETRDMVGTAAGAAGLDLLNATRLRYIARTIAFSQFKGSHKLPRAANMQIEYFGSFSQARRDDPAIREMVYRYNEENDYWRVDTSVGTMGDQMYLELVDNNENAAADLIFPFQQWKGLDGRVKIGAWIDAKQREFQTRRYYFTPASGLAGQTPIGRENIINRDTIGGGIGAAQGGTRPFTLFEGTRAQDNYDAWQRVVAGYAMLDLPFVRWFKISGGARIESNVIAVTPIDIYAIEGSMPDASLAPVRIVDLDVLPAASLIFSPAMPKDAGDFNIRLSGAKTVARPEFRELAPFEFRDYVGGFDKQGNPALRSTKIWNADLRFEWFPRTNEVVAISGFFKHFTDPIEEVAAARIPPKSSFANAESAINGGVEFEVRKALDFLAPKNAKQARKVLRDFSVGANFAYIYSRVDLYPRCYPLGGMPPVDPVTQEPLPGYVEREGCRPEYEVSTNARRPLQGQSPWIANAYLDYDNSRTGTNVRALYNAFGPHIVQVSALGLPDIYQQPRHMVDIVAAQRVFAFRRNDWGDLRNELLVTFEIENLLNTIDLQTQTLGGTAYTTWRTYDGTGFKIGLTWRY